MVCVKQVPVTAEVDLLVDESGRRIDSRGLVMEMNEWDEYAIEEALLIKERIGGTVTAITMGPMSSDSILRRCLAKGADHAILLRDEAFEGSDAYATAKTLHAAISGLEYDLVFTGARSGDHNYSAVGGILAALLGVAHAQLVKKVKVVNRSLIVHRELEEGLEEALELPMPALLGIQTGINEPRYVSIMGIRKARKKELTVMDLNNLCLNREEVGETGSWLKVQRIYAPLIEKETEIITGSPEDVVGRLVEIFKYRGLI
ncbi:MAG: electron transfer flavoprotein subunit beta/FixA family protein [Candidatus Bathyarchaeota archaeon]|nr:electron transfer flavoprotein subunit beta/FixA family protein [Candidatus Bathyarchaeota archaeon]